MQLKHIFILTITLFLNFAYILGESGEESVNEGITEEEFKQISFYQGYMLYKNSLESSDITYDIDQILEGIKEAHKGESLKYKEDDLESVIKKFQKYLYEKMKSEGLAQANQYLSNVAKQEGVTELVKGKLYYKILQKGVGAKVEANSAPLITYTITSVKNGKEEPPVEIDEPKVILLTSAIAGFSQAVIGMQEHEKRILYIHPDLGYGAVSRRSDPNSILIFQVEIIKANDSKEIKE